MINKILQGCADEFLLVPYDIIQHVNKTDYRAIGVEIYTLDRLS